MNIAFIQIQEGGTTRTRARLTDLERADFVQTLAEGEALESFLYQNPPGPEMPCGPDGEEWRRLCEFLRGDADLCEGFERALAASRHRFLALVT